MNLIVSIDPLVIIGEYQGVDSCELQIMTNRLHANTYLQPVTYSYTVL